MTIVRSPPHIDCTYRMCFLFAVCNRIALQAEKLTVCQCVPKLYNQPRYTF